MGCPQVEKLRQDASKIYLQLKEKLKKARELGSRGETAPGRNASGTDYEPLLRRKLQILSGEIDRHLTRHGCESADHPSM
jgi:hypothetical protein